MDRVDLGIDSACDSVTDSLNDEVAEREASLTVTVVFSPGVNRVDEVVLRLAAGSTVADALRSSGLAERYPGVALGASPCAVWGTLCGRDAMLRDHDRVELYRPLQVDPMQARRKRHSLQRSKLGARR